MPDITRSVVIDAPRQDVWDVLADFGNVSRTNKGITASKLTSEQTSGVGTERVCDLSMMNAKLYERVVGWEEGSRLDIDIYDWRRLPGIAAMGAQFLLADQGARTQLTATMSYAMAWGPVGRTMDRLLMRSRNISRWEDFLAGIKHHVETGELVDGDTQLDRAPVTA